MFPHRAHPSRLPFGTAVGAALTDPGRVAQKHFPENREWQALLWRRTRTGTFYFAASGTFYFAPALGSVLSLAKFVASLDGQRQPALLQPASLQQMLAPPERTTWYGMREIGAREPGGHTVVFAATVPK
jgi:hypothetical protein